MSDLVDVLFSLFALILTVVAVVLALLLFVAAIFLFQVAFGALLGWLLSLTILGDWVRSAFLSFGFDVNLVHLGALLGFITAIVGGSVLRGVMAGFTEWATKKIKGDDD